MAEDNQKAGKSTTVRIAVDEKELLQDTLREKAAREKRMITEMETVTGLVKKWNRRERKKLGI